MAETIIKYIQKFSWLLVILILIFGWTSPFLMVATFICMVAPVIFSFGNGRAWCGNFCPRHSFSNEILSRLSPNKRIPPFCKSSLFRLLMFILLMSLFASSIYFSNGSLIGIGFAVLKMMLLTTVIQITLGVMVHAHLWCTFCPMGTVSSLITKLKGSDDVYICISKDCSSCGKCKTVCPLQLDISKWRAEGKVRDASCMNCKSCMRECPQKALSWGEE